MNASDNHERRLLGGMVVKNPPANTRDAKDSGWIPGLGRSPGVGNGNPLFSILAWKILWTEEPGGLQSMGSQRVRHDCIHTHTCVCVCVYT